MSRTAAGLHDAMGSRLEDPLALNAVSGALVQDADQLTGDPKFLTMRVIEIDSKTMPKDEQHFGPLKRDQPFFTNYGTKDGADKTFYDGYDPLFLARKAAVLYGIYKNYSGFMDCSESWNLGSSVGEEELKTLLAVELHCASFHQAEAMIALLLAEYQNRPDWVFLTTYRNTEIKNAAKALVSHDYAAISSGTAKSIEDFINAAVLATWQLSQGVGTNAWKESIRGIGYLIELVAEQFLSGHEYNSYKHGLRVVAGSARFAFVPSLNSKNITSSMSMRHSMTYLQMLKVQGGYGGQMVTKEIDPEYSHELIQCMAPVLSLIKTMRVARIDKELPRDVSFPPIDVGLLASKRPIARFAITY